MIFILKRLFLGFLLIAGISAILLLSDVDRRRPEATRVPRVALLQFASSPLMDDGVEGMTAGLKENGFSPGESLHLQLYNAEGDMPTANAIASEMTAGQFDLVMTSGTPAMQAVANANRSGKTTHVFGLVADPFGAGVGINRENPLDHPPYLVGIGSFIPVAPSFLLAQQMFPDLKIVGAVWNPAESNSEAFTREARRVCADLNIELLEANADNSAGVFEAAGSLVARGVEALWMGGDNTVAAAAVSVLSAARSARIPVFSILTGNAERGALFEAGADFVQIGRQTGQLAARILRGVDPATIAVENSVPEMLVINRTVLGGLRDPWQVTDEILKRAHPVIDDRGTHSRSSGNTESGSSHVPLAKTWNVSMISFVESPSTEEAERGVIDGLSEASLVPDRDYEIQRYNSQGDVAVASSMVDAAITRRTDLFISISTPSLQAVLARGRGTPLVFTLVANPLLAGAGSSNQEHLSHVTGIFVVSPFEEMMSILQEFPSIKRVGTLFAPAEVNSVFYKDMMLSAAQRAGIEVELIGVSTSGEVSDAAISLCSRDIDAVCQIADNLSSSTFVAIAKAASRFKLPIFTFNSALARQGAAVAMARDYYDGGRDTGLLAARVMRGESPASIPFRPIERMKLVVNLEAAARSGLEIPASLQSRADEVIGRPSGD